VEISISGVILFKTSVTELNTLLFLLKFNTSL